MRMDRSSIILKRVGFFFSVIFETKNHWCKFRILCQYDIYWNMRSHAFFCVDGHQQVFFFRWLDLGSFFFFLFLIYLFIYCIHMWYVIFLSCFIFVIIQTWSHLFATVHIFLLLLLNGEGWPRKIVF